MNDGWAVIVLSGYNIRAVIAFCRWASAHAVNVCIVANDLSDPIFQTAYRRQVSIVRTKGNLCIEDFREWMRALREHGKYKRFLILPSSEYLNRFLLANRRVIEEEGCVIPLADKLLYERISDKQTFTELCLSYNLVVPREFSTIPDQLPFVAKPRSYFSASRNRQLVPHLVFTNDDLQRFIEEENASEFFFQEYVAGRSVYLLALLRKQGDPILFSQENLMQQTRGGSIILAKKADIHLDSVSESYVKMLSDLRFFGLIMVEFRINSSNRLHYMIEANPRLWGPIQFCIDCNVDLFGEMLRDNGFEVSQFHASDRLASHYFWSTGITTVAQPIAFHNYSSEQFISDLPVLRPQDILFRRDTLGLFLKEAGM